MEECARNMAFDNNGDVVSQEDYREPMERMGEAGQAAIQNIRKIKEKQMKFKAEDTDKDYRVFDSQEEAISFGNSLGPVKLRKRLTGEAPKELQTNGINPSSEELFKRMWGINNKNYMRMVPTDDNKWCVYWRPSLIEKEESV
jgi:hypothetical protein